MKAKDIVKELMKKRGHTNYSLAEKLGYANHSSVSELLRKKSDLSVTTLLKFLEEMDCELIVKSKLDDKTVWKVTKGE